jgi:DNA-binding LacI/PurR family transcriptional regulator
MIIPAYGLKMEQVRSICEDIPVVHIESQPLARLPSVSLDDRYGTQQVVEHLIALGHSQFCEISGPLNWYSAQIRHHACIETLAAHGIGQPVHIEGNWSTPGGYQATRRLIEQGHQFSAVIAANDSMALGAYRALHQAGLSVPDDVSVVGFDDILEAAYFTPPLTTVSHDYIQLGAMGFAYLMQMMDDPEVAIEQRLIQPKLIVRESTAPFVSR